MTTKTMTRAEAEKIMPYAMGRLVRLLHGEIEVPPRDLDRMYDEARAIIMACRAALR